MNHARPVLAALALLVLMSAAATTFGAFPPGPPQERHYTLEAVAVACGVVDDGVCLTYNGTFPGPMLDVNLGDTVVVTLVNRIAETVALLEAPEDVKARLSNASVSFHVHGTAIANDMDGVRAHAGTRLTDSFAPPGGSFEYRFRAAFAGSWHYHDHVLGADGAEGTARGLFGGLIVRNAGEPRPDHVFDLRVHDSGPNLGAGLSGAVAAGERFELLVAALGNLVWTVTLEAPDGSLVRTLELGPGMSERIVVPEAQAGAYRWSAHSVLSSGEGEVVAS